MDGQTGDFMLPFLASIINCIIISLNIFYFNLVRYKYKYIQVTECKRIRMKAESLCYSSPA